MASFCPPVDGEYNVDLRVLWWSPNPPSEKGQDFLGAREGAGTSRRHYEAFRRCEAAVRVHVDAPLVVAPGAASTTDHALPACDVRSSTAGHWRRLPPRGSSSGLRSFAGSPVQLGAEGGMWSDAHWGPFMGPEEEGHSRWAWASRSCVHTYFTPAQAQRCAVRASRNRILLHGDSQSRALYISLARWLGQPVLGEAEMKRRTNQLNITRHRLRTERGVTLAQSYTWNMLGPDLERLEAEVQRMRPNVVVLNFAASHTLPGDGTDASALPRAFVRWFDAFARRLHDPKPSLWVYQRMGALLGMRAPYFREGLFRRYDTAIWEALQTRGFVEFATRLPELHRFDAKPQDGWHLLMNSTTSMLTANLLFELLCTAQVATGEPYRKT